MLSSFLLNVCPSQLLQKLHDVLQAAGSVVRIILVVEQHSRAFRRRGGVTATLTALMGTMRAQKHVSVRLTFTAVVSENTAFNI